MEQRQTNHTEDAAKRNQERSAVAMLIASMREKATGYLANGECQTSARKMLAMLERREQRAQECRQ